MIRKGVLTLDLDVLVCFRDLRNIRPRERMGGELLPCESKSLKTILSPQVFQAYYTTTILKGTPPSTM